MNTARPCILLYNPISGHGHLDSWNSLFAGILLERGFHVLCLTPDSARLKNHLVERGLADCSRVQILPWEVSKPPVQLTGWHYIWDTYIYKRPDSFPAIEATWSEQCTKSLLRFGFGVIRFTCRSLLRGWHGAQNSLRRIQVMLGRPDESSYLSPKAMATRVQSALLQAQIQPNFLFIMYMDMFKSRIRDWRPLTSLVGLPWGGIRFAPRTMKDGKPAEEYYNLPVLRGMCLLDEAACRHHQDALPAKVFQFLPDITNSVFPEREPALAIKLRARAAGRTVVILGGSLDTRKNLLGFSRLARIADPDKWFFALVGRVYHDTLSAEDKQELAALACHKAGNVLLHLDFLDDERDFNAVMHASDIIFAVYKDFPYSSNMLSKAAHLRRPILVSNRYLMGERVRRYCIGLAVPENDPTAALAALDELRARPVSEEAYADYRKDFCEQAMGDALVNFLQRCRRDAQ